MIDRVAIAQLQVASELYEFVEKEIAPDLGLDTKIFWNSFSDILLDLSPQNLTLLQERDNLQLKIDSWHKEKRSNGFDIKEYKLFLQSIGYLEVEDEPCVVTTDNVDVEISSIAGPQLVVPINNARFALNAANARWGSLFDALYGSDIIINEGDCRKTDSYNPVRGKKVIDFAMGFLNMSLPLESGSHSDVTSYRVTKEQAEYSLQIILHNGQQTSLKNTDQFSGFKEEENVQHLVFCHHGLHMQLVINRESPTGQQHVAGVSDIILESALTAIQDCEDSVTAVDTEDKVSVYRNWLGLMRGNLSIEFEKNGETVSRSLNPDLLFTAKDGNTLTLPGRSLLLVRNVGHLMTTEAILYGDEGRQAPEGIVDAMITSLIAMFDLKHLSDRVNSQKGNIYIVKPKMHGPAEVAFSNTLFNRVEDTLGIPRNTIKMGVMDEERRTTVNLKACIRECRERLMFINTGFLDRTGDEIHTSMEAGPMRTKDKIKQAQWLSAYEDSNVDSGLACGMTGRAQIGKGMWAIPDQMSAMLATKISHLQAGANTSWVPSPTAATIHAMHYHQVDVASVQMQLKQRKFASLEKILSIPLLPDPHNLTASQIQRELENNIQGILGYVVRWIDQGVGCSTVPDINNIGLMEDKATLRISSQLIANWLHHDLCNLENVMDAFKKMAKIVDEQNKNDLLYEPMAPNFDGLAFKSALEIVLKGREQPNGYTEPLLHKYRINKKTKLDSN